MTDGQALRREVVRNPDDDTLRLIYADWLDENGRPERAALIRAQVEEAAAEPFSPAARAAAGRAEPILRKNHRRWTEHLEGHVADPRFVRGFVGHVAAEAGRFPQVAGPVFGLEPVQSLFVYRAPGGDYLVPLEPVFDVPELQRLTALDLSAAHPLQVEWEALLKCPHLDRLTDLSLRGNPLFPPWLTELLASPSLPGLAGLDLSDIPNIGPGFLAAVEKAPGRRFRRLNLSGVRLLGGEVQRLLASPCLGRVEELRLVRDGGPLNPGPLRHLDLGWVLPAEGTLRVLDLGGQGLGPEGVRELARWPGVPRLRWLGLAANGIGPDGVETLTRARQFNLYHLDVSRNGLDPDDVEALRDRFPGAVVVSDPPG